MNLKEAHELADNYRECEKLNNLNLTSNEQSIVILDDRIHELETQQELLLDACRTILNGLENVRTALLRGEIAKYDKNLPKFKDIIGLFNDKTEGVNKNHEKNS